MKTNHTDTQYSSSQGRFPEFFEESLEIDDVVFDFDRIMEEINIGQYLKPPKEISLLGRPGYNRVKMLKTVLFAMTDTRETPFCRSGRSKTDAR